MRVPQAGNEASTVRGFKIGSEPRVVIGRELFTVEAAREYAAKINATCDAVTPRTSYEGKESFLAYAISVARESWGISQRELADMCGISRSHLGSIERDEFSPDEPLSRHIARTLGEEAGRRHKTASA